MANNNNVPKVDQTARLTPKKVPVAPPGVGNPGSWPFGPGEVQTNPTNPSVDVKGGPN